MPRYCLLLISLLLLCTPAYPQIIPSAGSDTVSMPWDAFIRLRKQAEDPVSEKSRRYSYQNARYTGTASIDKNDYIIRFQAVVTLNTFGNQPLLVPFLSKQLNVESLNVDGNSSAWTEKDGFFHVLISGEGPHTVEGTFAVILDSQTWPRSFYLPLAEIPGTEIILHVPDTDIQARFDPGVVTETQAGSSPASVGSSPASVGSSLRLEPTRETETGSNLRLEPAKEEIRGYVPAVSGVNIRWLKRSDEKKEVPLKMGAKIYTYVSLEEKGANCQSEVDFRILQGETNFFRIHVPDTVDILEVSAPDAGSAISQWFTEDIENARMIHIYASYRQHEQFRVRLVCERTETQTNYQFSAPHIIPQSLERYEHFIAAGSGVNVEINQDRAARIEPRDVRFLPPEIREFAKSDALFYYKTSDEDFDLRFQVKSHEKAPLVTTRIERAEADSVLTEAGTFMTKAAYYIKNNQAQFLRLKLPENSKLLSAFLSGQEIQPALDGEQLLIPISKSADTAFPVEIAFLTKSDRFSTAGSGSLRLPDNELPVGELSWRLYTPQDYQVIYFGGNIPRVRYSFFKRLGWLLGSAATSKSNLAYAGFSENSPTQNYQYSPKGLKQRFKRYKEDEFSSDKRLLLNNQIQVQIPITGKRYRFESYLIKDFTPEITFFYMNSTIRDITAFLISVSFFVLIVWTLVIIFERAALPQSLCNIKNYLKYLLIASFLGLLLLVFSLGVNQPLGDSIALGFIIFAFWQNRQVSKRFHAAIAGKRSYFTEMTLAGLLILVIPTMFSDAWSEAAFVSGISILFHALLNWFRKKGKTAEVVAGIILFAFLILLSAVPESRAKELPPVDLPAMNDTRLNLSWETVEDLLGKIDQKQQQAAEKPASDYIFGTLEISGRISKQFAELRFTVPLSILSRDYVKIPLFDTSVAITQARFDGESVPLHQENGTAFFELRRPTDDLGILEISVILPVKEKGGVNEFAVKSPMIRGGLAELTFGEDIQSVVLYGTVWQKREGQTVTAALGRSGELRGELATFLRKKETADETSKRVKKVYSTTYTLISLGEGVAAFYSSIRYQILNDQVREFVIRLPADVVVHEIVGDDLEEWSVRSSENGVTTYQVRVLYPVAERYDLSLQYEKLIRNDETKFSVPCLEVVGVARDVGYLGLEMQAQAEIFLEKLAKARLIDIRELPAIIREDAYSPFVYALRYVERPYEIVFGIRKHKNFQTDPAIADRIQYSYVISPRGNVMAQVRLWIRNSRKQFAGFFLPENATLVSTFLDSRSVKPAVGQNGEILLPLKRQSSDPFILDVIYEDAPVSLSSAGGYIQVKFPRVDIPSSIVASDIYIPEDMYFSEPGGDFQEIKRVEFVPWGYGSDMFHMASVRRDEELAVPQNVRPEPQRAEIQTQADRKTGGTLSLKIELPRRGKKISVNTFYVPAGVSLNTRFFLCHEFLYRLGYALAIFLFAAAGYFFIRPLPAAGSPLRSVSPLAGFLILFWLIPFSWKEILVYLIAGGTARYLYARIKSRKNFV